MARGESDRALKDAVVTGSLACVVTLAVVAACGAKRRQGGAVAPINAISHVWWGEEAALAVRPDVRHTVPAVAINEGAGIFWAAVYERLFGRAAKEGRIPTALVGGATVATLAYLVDYHVVPRRLTPGWEYHLGGRSLAAVYAALAVSFAAPALLRRVFRRAQH
jgi:hypothetical protein